MNLQDKNNLRLKELVEKELQVLGKDAEGFLTASLVKMYAQGYYDAASQCETVVSDYVGGMNEKV